jgi:hypothetical protein
MDILKSRTEDLYEEVKKKIETDQLKTVDDVAEAIVKGAEERSITFWAMKEHAAFYIMGEIDSESLYQMVESK